MKVLNVLLAAVLIASVAAPDIAFAKKKNSSSSYRKMSSKERSDAINWCRKKYPGPYTWNVEYGIYSGKRQWWCVPSY
jgi:uncharacterized protein YycO